MARALARFHARARNCGADRRLRRRAAPSRNRAPVSELLLALDGALGPFSAALIAPDGSGTHAASLARNDALERGLSFVDELLAGRPLAEIRTVAVTVGPGTFTGLRIALSFAKSFAFARGLPLVGLSSYD